jgi:hypothetical protein
MNDHRFQSRDIKHKKKIELTKIYTHIYDVKCDFAQVQSIRETNMLTLKHLKEKLCHYDDNNSTMNYINRHIGLTKKKLFLLDCEQTYLEDDLKTQEHRESDLLNIYSTQNAPLFNLSCKMDKIATKICDLEREIKYLQKTFCL